MNAKYGLLAFMLLLSVGFSFFDDFESYYSIADAGFTSNYTILNSSHVTIQSSGGVYLKYAQGAVATTGVFLNQSKVSVSAPFNVSFNLLAGSNAVNTITPFSVLFYLNGTNYKGEHAYIVNFYFNSSEPQLETELRRCDGNLHQLTTCGVQLKVGTPLNISDVAEQVDLGYPLNSTRLTANAPISIISTASGVFRVYFNRTLVLESSDSVYNNGGVALLSHHLSASYGASLYFDNLVVNAVYSGVQGWNIISFPYDHFYSASKNWIGVGTPNQNTTFCDAHSIIYFLNNEVCEKCGYGTYLKDFSQYGSDFSPCLSWFDNGYPTGNLYLPAFLLTYQGAFLNTNSETALNFESDYLTIIAPHQNTCFAKSGAENDFDLYGSAGWYETTGGLTWTPLLDNPLYENGAQSTGTPHLFMADSPFYCISPENLTFRVGFTWQNEVDYYDIVIPIGKPFDNQGNVDYTSIITSVNNSKYLGATNLPITPKTPNNNPDQPFSLWFETLLSPLVIFLAVAVFLGVMVTQQTRSSQIGLIVILAGVLVLSLYGIVPWYITILITLIAGFFIVTEVRKGVFGSASTA